MWANLIVGVFKLLPGLPLDGGRMLRAAIWKVTGRPARPPSPPPGPAALALGLFVPGAGPAGGRPGSAGDLYSVVWLAVLRRLHVDRSLASGHQGRPGSASACPGCRPACGPARRCRSPADTPLAEAIRLRRREPGPGGRGLSTTDPKPIAILNETAVMATPPQRRPWIEAGSLARTLRAEPGAARRPVRHGPAGRHPPGPLPSEYLLVEPSGQVYGVLAAGDVDLAFACV